MTDQTRRASVAVASLLAAALALSGCGETAAPDNATTASNASVATPANTAMTEPTPAKAEAPQIVLEGGGLRLIDPQTTHATPLPFGMPKDQAIKALALAMGGKPDVEETNEDCGPGPLKLASWNKGLATYYQDDKFVGWAGATDLKTADGIGFGSTRKALDAAYHPKVEETSLGTEFEANGISGTLESKAPDAAVSEVWAGMTCVAR